MTRSELENFVQKFQQLRQAGYTAHLDVDTHAGQSWVALRVMLGPIKYTQKKPQQRHRSPSYLRRQERRKAARLAAEVPSNKNDNETEKVSESIQTEEVSNVAEDCNKDNTEAEEVKTAVFNCEICDFNSNKESGLRIHMSKKHAIIEQLDGNIEVDESDSENEEYDISKDPNYELRTYLSYASCECCAFSQTSCGRKVSTAWIKRGTPRWSNQILPFKPGQLLE